MRLGAAGGSGAIDPHHLLLGRMHSAGKNARLGRRSVAARPGHSGDDRTLPENGHQAIARTIAPHHANHDGRAAERGDITGGVAGAARNDLGRVVVQDQDRSLAGDPRDLAVDEFVDDQVAEHRDAASFEGVHELDEAPRIDRERSLSVLGWRFRSHAYRSIRRVTAP